MLVENFVDRYFCGQCFPTFFLNMFRPDQLFSPAREKNSPEMNELEADIHPSKSERTTPRNKQVTAFPPKFSKTVKIGKLRKFNIFVISRSVDQPVIQVQFSLTKIIKDPGYEWISMRPNSDFCLLLTPKNKKLQHFRRNFKKPPNSDRPIYVFPDLLSPASADRSYVILEP